VATSWTTAVRNPSIARRPLITSGAHPSNASTCCGVSTFARGPRREDHLVDDVDREIADDAIRLGDARAGDVEALARRPLLARQAGDGEREVFVQRRELPVDEVLAGDGAGDDVMGQDVYEVGQLRRAVPYEATSGWS